MNDLEWPLTQISFTPLFNVEYLTNGTRYRHSYNEILLVTYTLLEGVILNDVEWLAKHLMTSSIARSFCDSWTSCSLRGTFCDMLVGLTLVIVVPTPMPSRSINFITWLTVSRLAVLNKFLVKMCQQWTKNSAVANRSRSASYMYNSLPGQIRTCAECLVCQITYVDNSDKTSQKRRLVCNQ